MISEAEQLSSETTDASLSEKVDAALKEAVSWLDEHGEEAKVSEIKFKTKKLETALERAQRGGRTRN